MREIRVDFVTTVPDGISDVEILDWLRFCLSGGGLQNSSPLIDIDINADWTSVCFKDA